MGEHDELLAELVEAQVQVGLATRDVARAIKDGVGLATDPHGGSVGSLTEAVFSVSLSLNRIADAVFDLAEARRER